MLSHSISDSVIFQNFLGSCPQTPLVLACFACLYALHTMRAHIPASSTSTMMTNLAVPSLFKSLDAPLIAMYLLAMHQLVTVCRKHLFSCNINPMHKILIYFTIKLISARNRIKSYEQAKVIASYIGRNLEFTQLGYPKM